MRVQRVADVSPIGPERRRHRVRVESPRGPPEGLDRQRRKYARLAAQPSSWARGGLVNTLGRTLKALQRPSSALGRPAVNLIRGYSSPPQPMPDLAKSAAGHADGRPCSLPDAVSSPRSESGARQARRLDRANPPKRAVVGDIARGDAVAERRDELGVALAERVDRGSWPGGVFDGARRGR